MPEIGISALGTRVVPPEMPVNWYAVTTKSNCERIAAAEISSKGIIVYLPLRTEVHTWTDRKKKVEVPLFAGYLFVRMTDQVENRLRVVRSNGAVRILGTGTTIEPVRDVEIESIRKLISSGTPFTSVPFLREGESVRVKRGALEGVEGILTRFKNETRLVISVEMLAQSVSVEVDVRNVEPAGRRSVRRVKAS